MSDNNKTPKSQPSTPQPKPQPPRQNEHCEKRAGEPDRVPAPPKTRP